MPIWLWFFPVRRLSPHNGRKIPVPETGTGCVENRLVVEDACVSPAHIVQNLGNLTTGQGAVRVEGALAVHAANHAEVVRTADGSLAGGNDFVLGCGLHNQDFTHNLVVFINPLVDVVAVGQVVHGSNRSDVSACRNAGIPCVINGIGGRTDYAIGGNTGQHTAIDAAGVLHGCGFGLIESYLATATAFFEASSVEDCGKCTGRNGVIFEDFVAEDVTAGLIANQSGVDNGSLSTGEAVVGAELAAAVAGEQSAFGERHDGVVAPHAGGYVRVGIAVTGGRGADGEDLGRLTHTGEVIGVSKAVEDQRQAEEHGEAEDEAEDSANSFHVRNLLGNNIFDRT